MKVDGVAAGQVCCGIDVDAVSDGPHQAVIDGGAAGEFKCDPQRVIGLNGSIDGDKGECRLTGVVLSAAYHHQCRCDQCEEHSGYQKGTRFHETDLIPANLPNFVQKGLILGGSIGLF